MGHQPEHIVLIIIKNPMEPDQYTEARASYVPGQAVIEYVRPILGDQAEMAVNGNLVSRDYVLSPGDTVACCPYMGKMGGDSLAVVRTLALLAAVAAAPYAAAALTGAASVAAMTGWGWGAAVGIAAGGRMLVNAVLPYNGPKSVRFDTPNWDRSPNYGFSRPANVSAEGTVVPSLIGERTFAPPLIGAYRYQPRGNNKGQKMRMLFCMADDLLTPLSDDDIIVDGQPIDNYPDAHWDARYGDELEEDGPKWFHDTLTETQYSYTLVEQDEVHSGTPNLSSFVAGTWQPSSPYQVTEEVMAVKFGLYFPDGLKWYYEKRHRRQGEWHWETVRGHYNNFSIIVRYRAIGSGTWTEKTCPIKTTRSKYYKAFEKDLTVELPADSYEFQFTVDFGDYSGGTLTPEFLADPVHIKTATGYSSTAGIPIYTTADSDVDRIGIGYVLPNGLYRIKDAGNFGNHTVKIVAQLRRQGETEWEHTYTTKITAGTSDVIRRRIYLNAVTAAKWEIRVYISGLMPTDTRYQHTVQLDYIQEGTKQKYVYRGLATLAVEIPGNEYFANRTPTVEVRGKCADYATGRSSSNPGWAAYYRLKRHKVPDSRINFSEFSDWADACDAAGLTCALYLDTQLDLQEVLDQIGMAGWARVRQIGRIWRVIRDDIAEPVQTFNSDNIIAGSFSEAFLRDDQLANAVMVYFFDKTNEYRKTPVLVRDPNIDSASKIKKTETTLYPVDNLPQAKKTAMRLLNQTRLSRRLPTWLSSIDAIDCMPGHVVYLQNDLPVWGYAGGRVIAADADTVTVDILVDYSDSEHSSRDFRLLLRHVDPQTGAETDHLEVLEILNPYDLGSPANETVSTYTLAVGQSWERTPEAGSMVSTGWVTGTEASTGNDRLSIKKFRIVDIEHHEGHRFRIVASEYYDDMYEDDYVVELPAAETGITTVDMPAVVSAWAPMGQTHVDYISLSWVGNAAYYYIHYRIREGTSDWSDWYYLGRTNATQFRADLPTGQEYQFSISVSSNPDQGVFTNIDHVGFNHTPQIEPVTNIRCVQTGTTEWTGKDCQIEWDPYPVSRLVRNYRVEVLSPLDAVLRTELVDRNETQYSYTLEKNASDHNGTPAAMVRFRVTVIDINGGETQSIVQSLTADLPNSVTNLRTTRGSGSVFEGRVLDVVWDASTADDLAYYEVTITHGAGDLRTEKIVDISYRYTYEMNQEDGAGTASNSIVVKIRAVDVFGQASGYTTGTFTNPAPAMPSGLSAEQWMNGVRFTWQPATEWDFDVWQFRIKLESEAWSDWYTTRIAGVDRFLDAEESDLYDGAAMVYIEVVAVDTFGSASGVASANAETGTVWVPPTAIEDIGQLSGAFKEIPVLVGDSWSNNTPSAGSVSWNAHELWYEGVKYDIAAGNTADQYIYWVNASSSYATSATEPTLSEGDFIIAQNNGGTVIMAWSADANRVIGSAYLGQAAVLTANIGNLQVTNEKVNDLDAIKIHANTIVVSKFTQALRDEVQSALPSDADLVAYWPMDETSGTSVKDVSGNGNDASTAGSLAWEPGISGNCMRVSSGLVQISSLSEYPSSEITFYCWGKFTRGAEWQAHDFFGCNWPYAGGWVLYSYWNGTEDRITAGIYDTLQQNVGVGGNYAGKWLCLAATYDGSNLRLYINGEEVGSTAVSGWSGTQSGVVTIGDGDVTEMWVDDSRIYNRALTASEIKALYKNPGARSGGRSAMSSYLGALAWNDLVELAELGETVIVGGFLKNELIQTGSILIGQLSSGVSGRIGVSFRNGFEATEFDDWTTTTGDTLTQDADAFSGSYSGLFQSTETAPGPQGETECTYIAIPEEVALQFGGKRIRVTVYAKRPASGASAEFAVAYSTADTGNSGWIDFTPTTAWQPFSFYYDVPAPNVGGPDYLGIWGDTAGGGNGVLIDNVVIDIAGSEADLTGWQHPLDTSFIHGGMIYTESVYLNRLIGNTGTLTISGTGKIAITAANGLDINTGGTMRINGGQLNVSAGKINVTAASGVEINATNGLLVKSANGIQIDEGGDLRMNNDISGDQAKIRFYDTAGEKCQIYAYGDVLRFYPSVNGSGALRFGYSTMEWDQIDLHADNLIRMRSYSNAGIDIASSVLLKSWQDDYLYFGYSTYRSLYPYPTDTISLGRSGRVYKDVWATDTTINASDIRKKEQVQGCYLGLDFIRELQPVSYKWRDYVTPAKFDANSKLVHGEIEHKFSRRHYGLVAQDVEETLRRFGIDSNDFAGFIKDKGTGEYALRLGEFIAPIITSLQELDADVQLLKKKMEKI